MSTLQISKHKLYFKQTVTSVESWAWQPYQELLQGKTVQTQHLFLLTKYRHQIQNEIFDSIARFP